MPESLTDSERKTLAKFIERHLWKETATNTRSLLKSAYMKLKKEK